LFLSHQKCYYSISIIDVSFKKGFFMKRQSLLLSTLLIMAPGLYAATMNDVMNQLLSAGQLLYNSALGARHVSTMSAWQQAFDKAKIFVTDNSKNLIGTKDSIIIASMTELEQVNRAFVNALNTISKTLPKAPISQLLPVAMNARKAYDKIYTASFTLGGKNDAKKVLIHLSRFLEDASKKLYDNLLVRGQMEESIPTPPRTANQVPKGKEEMPKSNKK
jgi:hypothetical protein